MKKITFVLLTLIAMFAITSCKQDGGIFEPVGNFWAQDAVTEAFYRVDAEKLAENSWCVVWAEKGSGVTVATANNIANEYALNIYDKMISTFGWNENVQLQNGQIKNMNTMEYAHYLATGETSGAKLTILLLDIKDGYKPGVNESYVAGYFYLMDIYGNDPRYPKYKSNELDMIYIDTNPGLQGGKISEAYKTLAHEMQHLMNFVSSVAYRVRKVDGENNIFTMDIWVDEGLSSAAEWLYGGHNTSRTGWFNLNGDGDKIKGKIDVGNNFYVWDNRVTNSDPYPVLDDYATVYLFFQWLRLQSNSSIYKKIIQSTDYDNQAVINAFKNTPGGATYTNWGAMLKDWLKANITNSPSGRDGYNGDSTLKNISAPYAPQGQTSIGLYPGEGVYSYSTTAPSTPSSPPPNIKYEYLSGKQTLLTYNENPVNYHETNIDSLIENGQTTGIIKPSVNFNMPGSFDMKLGTSKISGPFPIGIGDGRRMNNNGGRIKFNTSKLKRVFIDE
jgi:hypothetical protein